MVIMKIDFKSQDDKIANSAHLPQIQRPKREIERGGCSSLKKKRKW